jgi:hypothetical protein
MENQLTRVIEQETLWHDCEVLEHLSKVLTKHLQGGLKYAA